jgi:DegV family protein with EDD domain
LRPAVLLIDTDERRRRALAQGLAALGYEVVPAVSAEEGQRFARGLGPSVVVGAEKVAGVGDGSLLEQFAVQDPARMRRTLVVLAEAAPGESSTGAEETLGDLPDDALLLPVGGLDDEEMVRRIRLVLVGREIGVDPDLELRYLVGDAALLPVVDLARELQRCRITAKVSLGFGWLIFENGLFTGAKAGKAEGAKAFGRLARRGAGPFRIFLETPIETPNLDEKWDDLLMLALEEKNLELPDLRTKVRPGAGGAAGELSGQERVLLQTIERCDTLGEVFDALPVADSLVLQAVSKMVMRGALRLEAPKHPVKVVTDSTSDLPPDLAASHDILVVPLQIVFGKTSFRDGVEIDAREFYKKLQQGPDHPSTRPPAEEDFYGHFHRLIVEQDILAVHISGKLSLTAENAQKAALRGIRSWDHLPKERHNCALEVVDSRSVSMGVGLLALFAARMAARGEKVFAIAQRLRQMVPRLHILFAVDTLDYLQRGGRIGKAQAWVGKLLAIKPILGVVGGEVVPVDKVRGGRRVHPRIAELVKERVDPQKPIVACVAHAQAPVWADRLRKLLEKNFKVAESLETDIGPVVGTHAGPGCVGVVFFQPTQEEWPLIAPLA